jgi:hypothetical protein
MRDFPSVALHIRGERSEFDRFSQMKIIAEAETYLNHEWNFFGIKNMKEPKVNWHYDFINKIRAPECFSFDIDHRNENVVGNIKIIWEKNRHHHLTILAMAFFLTREEKYAQEVAYQIVDWIQNNPYLYGVNWTHPLENAIRSISWIYCERLLRSSEGYERVFGESSVFWKSYYEHQKFIYSTYSRGSSANNHLIGEMAGLYLSSLVWPIFKESEKWKNFSKKKLEHEFMRQTFNSGINRELTFSYQIFVLEFVLLCVFEGKRKNEEFSTGFIERVSKSLRATYLLQDKYGTIPNYGDGDEGRAIQLGPIGNNRVDWLLEIGKGLINPNLPVRMTDNFEALLFDLPEVHSTKSRPRKYVNTDFSDAGIFLIRKSHSQFEEIRLLFDAGPLGMGSMAAHGHADALHFTLSIDGEPFFIDPGTYCYHTELDFREYFRGTRAHNTLVVNGMDQAKQEGPFLWSKKYNCVVHKWIPEENTIMASHDGYKKLGIKHFRTVKFNDILSIEDNINGKGTFDLDFRFHISPNASVCLQKNRLEISTRSATVIMSNELNIIPELITKSPDGGWYSPQFNVKVPTITLSYQKKLSLPVTQKFFIEFKKK